jgi:MtN3 and saliva related transmembrane protein
MQSASSGAPHRETGLAGLHTSSRRLAGLRLWFSLFGGALITVSFFPQVFRVFKLKSAREISMLFTFLVRAGAIFWLAYGIYFGLLPVILWNSASAVLVATLMVGKFKYGR